MKNTPVTGARSGIPASASKGADLDSSNDIFVGETPETSPTPITEDGSQVLEKLILVWNNMLIS